MSSPKGLRVVVFLSSVRPNRMAERVGKFLLNAITKNGMIPILFDPLEMQFEMVQQPIQFMTNPEEAPEWLKDAHEKIKTADAFIIASAEYNSTMPPALTNMLDHFPPTSFRYRPCGIVTYSPGPFGGIRVGTLLRTYIAEFGMFPCPLNVVIPNVHEAISADGENVQDRVASNVNKQLEQLRWVATALKNHQAIEKAPEA